MLLSNDGIGGKGNGNKLEILEKRLLEQLFQIKMIKLLKVLVTFTRKHPIYGKRIETSKKFTAHDEHNEAKVGDIVKIMETRPLSRTKRFRLVEIIERAVIV